MGVDSALSLVQEGQASAQHTNSTDSRRTAPCLAPPRCCRHRPPPPVQAPRNPCTTLPQPSRPPRAQPAHLWTACAEGVDDVNHLLEPPGQGLIHGRPLVAAGAAQEGWAQRTLHASQGHSTGTTGSSVYAPKSTTEQTGCSLASARSNLNQAKASHVKRAGTRPGLHEQLHRLHNHSSAPSFSTLSCCSLAAARLK